MDGVGPGHQFLLLTCVSAIEVQRKGDNCGWSALGIYYILGCSESELEGRGSGNICLLTYSIKFYLMLKK